ncbi:MAG: VWA domain-containing protein [Anaerolineae bacterium]|jgi:Ca-activated chloride channel family protein
MMQFARPQYLYLLTVLPLAALVALWAARRQRRDLARIGTLELIQALSASVSLRRRRWKAALWFVALLALIIALARPLWGTEVQVIAQRGVQVMAVLDVSASMLAEDVKPNRLERAKLTIEEVMARLGGHELGLVLFSGAAFVQFPLTSDMNTTRSFLRAAGPGSISRPGTALDEAIDVAVKGFPEDSAAQRVILLLTDGEGHQEGDVLAAAHAAAEAGVTIHAIGFGSSAGEPIPIRDEDGDLIGYKKDAQGETVLSRLDEATLQAIADQTGGTYRRFSGSGDEIDAVVDAVAALPKGETEDQFVTRGVERFGWFAGFALLALAAEYLVGERRHDAA